jgi:uncharacterized protein (DUF488 family)
MNAIKPPLFTVGHSNQTLDEFLSLLRQHEIELVADVRSVPKSKYASQFDAGSLTEALDEASIGYAYLGGELGGRPQGDDFYDAEGHVLYARLAESDEFFSGVIKLRSALARHRVAVMCAEEDPTHCHRRLLIGRVLHEQGHPVIHIRKDSRMETEEQLIAAEQANPQQLGLVGLVEEKVWRSAQPIRSASLSGAQRTSSSR